MYTMNLVNKNNVFFYNWFINCNKCTTLMQDVSNRRNLVGQLWEEGYIGTLCTYSSIFL